MNARQKTRTARTIPRTILLFLVLGAIAIAGRWLIAKRSRWMATTLADGSTLRFEAVTTGTNQVVLANAIEKAFERWIPFGGIEFGPIRLRSPFRASGLNSARALDGDSIVLWTSFISSPQNVFLPGSGSNQFKALAIGKDGRSYENFSTYPIDTPFPRTKLIGIPLTAFPRTEREFKTELWLGQKGRWERVADYSIANPLVTKMAPWQAKPMPQTNFVDGVEIVCDRVIAGYNLHPRGRADLSAAVSLSMHAASTTKDLYIAGCVIRDGMGNFRSIQESSFRFVGRPLKGDQILTSECALDTNDIWQIELTITEPPLAVSREETITWKNLAADSKPVTLTNAQGFSATASYDGSSFNVDLASEAKDRRLTFVGAQDPSGAGIQPQDIGSHSARLNCIIASSPASVTIQAGVQKFYVVRFYAKPVFIGNTKRLTPSKRE